VAYVKADLKSKVEGAMAARFACLGRAIEGPPAADAPALQTEHGWWAEVWHAEMHVAGRMLITMEWRPGGPADFALRFEQVPDDKEMRWARQWLRLMREALVAHGGGRPSRPAKPAEVVARKFTSLTVLLRGKM